MLKRLSGVFLFFWLFSAPVAAHAEPLELKWGGYLDAYYAYGLNQPVTNARNPLPLIFATQPSRQNEFNINLAFVELQAKGERVHGRLALQTGTAVPYGYSNEGSNFLAQIIQEAYAGYQVADGFWIDAGVFFSHIGFESWIPRDNWLYSRSLMSELTPYYQSGVRAIYNLSSSWAVHLHLINGWSNITENNPSKSLGLQVSYHPTEKFAVTSNHYYGIEPGNLARYFHDFWIKFPVMDQWLVALIADVGVQSMTSGSHSTWYQTTLLTRFQLSNQVALVGRLERYIDPDGVIVPTQTPNGFSTVGASLGVDVQLHPQVMWRNEARFFRSLDPVFIGNSGLSQTDGFIASSLGLTF